MGLDDTLLQKNHQPGEDKFLGLWEGTRGRIQLDYGDEIGLGNKDYRLVEI